MRRFDIPKEASTTISSYETDAKIKVHRGYTAAKAGNDETAILLVRLTFWRVPGDNLGWALAALGDQAFGMVVRASVSRQAFTFPETKKKQHD